MQLLRHVHASGAFGDERFHCPDFFLRAGFESTRVVENELRVTLEY